MPAPEFYQEDIGRTVRCARAHEDHAYAYAEREDWIRAVALKHEAEKRWVWALQDLLTWLRS